MRRTATGAFAAALLAFVAAVVIPWFTRERDMPAAVPSPPALERVSVDAIPPGGRLCMRDIAADRHGNQARFKVATYGKPGPPLQLDVSGEGYATSVNIASGYADNSVIRAPITHPPSAELVTACLRNYGRTNVALYAAADRAKSRARVDVNGRPVAATPQFAFYEAKPVSIGARLRATVDRMSTFRGFFGDAGLFWVLAALFALGVPVALGVALWHSFGERGLRRP